MPVKLLGHPGRLCPLTTGCLEHDAHICDGIQQAVCCCGFSFGLITVIVDVQRSGVKLLVMRVGGEGWLIGITQGLILTS